MRLANVEGRACVVSDTGGVDLYDASDGGFGPLVDDVIGVLDELGGWLADVGPQLDPNLSTDALTDDLSRLGPPVTRPRQVFAIGLNYADHATESGLELPAQPMVFPKWVSSLAGPAASVKLPADSVDWEVELVAVIGKAGRNIEVADALDHVAGFCVGQDLSERNLQMASVPPQFGLAKSMANFSPTGPWLTTLDELDDPNDLAIGCSLGDEVLQSSRTSHLIFDVPTVVAYLSDHVELFVGDLIFTGTPDGVGFGRQPQRFIEPGWTITSEIEGLGRLVNSFED